MKIILKLVITMTLVMTLFFQEVDASMGLCTSGGFKSFMTVGDLSRSSAQYQYLSNNTYDRGDGLMVTSDGYIAVAMGPYYGVMGDKFHITFSNGETYKFVKVDEKAHFTPGCEGMSSRDGSVIEAILSGNPSQSYSAAQYHGNVGLAYTEFAGTHSIVAINRVGGYTPPVEVTPAPQEEVSKIMIIYIPEEEHENLLFVDTEFSGPTRELVQVALINFQRLNVAENLYSFSSSLNIYKDIKVTPGFENYTNIKQGFLGNHGLKPEEFAQRLKSFTEETGLNTCKTLLIGHGLSQDHELLAKEGCNLVFVDTYDTFFEAKRILEITSGLSLEALSVQAGYYTGSQHDAYQDAYALIPIFSQLKMTEYLK